MGMKLDPEMERKVLELAGLSPAAPPARSPRTRPGELAAERFDAPGTWVVPVPTFSLANGREWRKRSSNTQAARRAVSKALGSRLDYLAIFGRHYHSGRPVRVRLTRLGGRKLDAGNLSPALKAVEDAVAMMLGADDGDGRWRVEFHQEPGGLLGVRIELEPM